MRLDRQLAEGESKSGAAVSRVELTELLEDPLERRRRNPVAGIADCKADVFFVALRYGNCYGAVSREFDRVGKEVDEGAAQFVLIYGKTRQAGGDVGDKCRVRVLSECGHLLECARYERRRGELNAL